jgi:hypothetical protein
MHAPHTTEASRAGVLRFGVRSPYHVYKLAHSAPEGRKIVGREPWVSKRNWD